MAVNKVVYGGNTIVDISDSTVSASDMAEGVIAYEAIGMHSTANACTPKLEIDMPEIPDVELPDSTKDMISAGVENYFKKCILDKPIIEDATYMNKTMGRYSFSYLCVSWDKVENATSYKIEVIKNDGTSKVYETNKSYFYTSRQDEFIMEGMDGAKVKVRAYGENDTFGVWSEKKEVSGVDSTGGVEVHTVDIPYQGKTERSYFYAQN